MCSFCTGKQSNWRRLSRWGHFSELDIDPLVMKEPHHFSSQIYIQSTQVWCFCGRRKDQNCWWPG